MRWQGAPLEKFEVSKAGIVSLEFAGTKERADSIVNTWQHAGLQQHAITNTNIDFGFIFFYSLLLFTLCLQVSLTQSQRVQKITQAVSLLGLFAGLLDVIENYFLYGMLHFTSTAITTQLTSWLATIKFASVAFVMLWIAGSLLSLIFKPKIPVL
jgi:hypothetical protein